jgi:hypothetical protein
MKQDKQLKQIKESLKRLQYQASRHSGIKNSLLDDVANEISVILSQAKKEAQEEINTPIIVSCYTELIKMPYERKLVSGLTKGSMIVASATKCSDGKTTYSDREHNPITEKQFEELKVLSSMREEE